METAPPRITTYLSLDNIGTQANTSSISHDIYLYCRSLTKLLRKPTKEARSPQGPSPSIIIVCLYTYIHPPQNNNGWMQKEEANRELMNSKDKNRIVLLRLNQPAGQSALSRRDHSES